MEYSRDKYLTNSLLISIPHMIKNQKVELLSLEGVPC